MRKEAFFKVDFFVPMPEQIWSGIAGLRAPTIKPVESVEGEVLPLAETIPDPSVRVEEEVVGLDTANWVRSLINILPEREKRIVLMIYGFENNQPVAQEDIAKQLEVSGQRVLQIKMRALERMRQLAYARASISHMRQLEHEATIDRKAQAVQSLISLP